MPPRHLENENSMSALNTITAVLGIDSSGMKEGTEAAGGALGKLKGGLALIGKAAAAAFAAAAAAVVAFTTKSIKEFAKFDKGMKEVFTLLPGESKKVMAGMEKDVLRLSEKMGILPEEIVPALYQAISAGVPKENVMGFLETASKASIGGVTDLETAVDGITSVVNAYGRETITAAQAADDMFTAVKLGKTDFAQLSAGVAIVTPIAKAAGVSFKDVMAAVAALTAQGVPTSEAFTQISAAIVSINTPTKKATAVAGELGISFADLQKDMRTEGGILNAMKKLNTATGGLPGPMKNLMGRLEGAKAAMSLMSDGGRKLSDSLTELQNNTGAADAAFGTMDDGMSRMWDKGMASLKAFQIEFGKKFEPLLADIIPIFKTIQEAVKALPWHEMSAELDDLGLALREAFGGEGSDGLKHMVQMAFEFVKEVIRMVKNLVILYKRLDDLKIIRLTGAAFMAFVSTMRVMMDVMVNLVHPLYTLAKLLGLVGDAAEKSGEQQAEATRKAELARVVAQNARDAAATKERWEKMQQAERDEEEAKKKADEAKKKAEKEEEAAKIKAAKTQRATGLAKAQGMGLNRAMLEKMAKDLGITGKIFGVKVEDPVAALLRKIGAGKVNMEEALRGTFGEQAANRMMAMGAENADRIKRMQELSKKSLSALAKTLDMSEKEMLDAFHTGRLRGPIVDIIRTKLAERNKIKRELSGTSAEEIEQEKKNLELVKKIREQEEIKAKVRAQELAEMKKSGAARAKVAQKERDDQNKAIQQSVMDQQKAARERAEGMAKERQAAGAPTTGPAAPTGEAARKEASACCDDLKKELEKQTKGVEKAAEAAEMSAEEATEKCCPGIAKTPIDTVIVDADKIIKVETQETVNTKVINDKPIKVEQTQLEKGALKVFIVEGTAPIKVLPPDPLNVWIKGGEAPITVNLLKVAAPVPVDIMNVAAPVPVVILGVLLPINVELMPNLQLEAIFRAIWRGFVMLSQMGGIGPGAGGPGAGARGGGRAGVTGDGPPGIVPPLPHDMLEDYSPPAPADFSSPEFRNLQRKARDTGKNQFAAGAPKGLGDMSAILVDCCQAVNRIDKNIDKIERRLRGCITNQ